MFLVICAVLLLIFGLLLYVAITWQFPRNYQALKHFDGPRQWPVFGNVLQLPSTLPECTAMAMKWTREFKSPAVVKFGPEYMVYLFEANHVEALLKSTTNITKSSDYRLIECWFGKGLLTSTGQKWHTRRKLLTPAFHFQILKDFIPVFNDQAKILVQILSKKAAKSINPFDICSPVLLCTLDVICETAFGIQIHAQEQSDTPYTNAVVSFTEIVSNRAISPWLWNDFFFYNFTSSGRNLKRHLKTLHAFTRKVIRDRVAEGNRVAGEQGKKKRLAFLDLLIESHRNGLLSLEDVREEVDTFMFEGHETTATGMMWTLYCLGRNPECQERLFEEIKEVFDETHTIPRGVMVNALFPALHRDPNRFPEPMKFIPERFLESSPEKHPFAFVPFSAGPRNCIGQKFAFMETKVVLSHLLRNFSIEAVQAEEDMDPAIQFVLRPSKGVFLKFRKRET